MCQRRSDDALTPSHASPQAALWRRYDAMERFLAAPLTERMLELARLEPGMCVLDLATGRGEPAIPAARRVAPNGHVLGIDIDPAVLDLARERAEREGVTTLRLAVADAHRLDGVPPASFDCALSRWGIMYLADPVGALRATRRALRPGGRLVAALWAEPERVEYATLPRQALEERAPTPPDEPDAPGVFRFADPGIIERDFGAAGFAIAATVEMHVPVMEAADAGELLAWLRAFGGSRLLAGHPPEVVAAWERSVVRRAEAYRHGAVIRLGGITRVVVAVPHA